MKLEVTRDAYLGLDNASLPEWEAWHRAMLAERTRVLANARFDPAIYDDESTSFADRGFRQLFLFMYDASFFDPKTRRYRMQALCDDWERDFGRVDEVLLWHAYPRLGFDTRTQFDFYREMPGGLGALRAEVSDVLHARGIRVFVDYNPWDKGTYDELAEIVSALDADGVMLDTMTDLPRDLHDAIAKRKRGVVFAPELRFADEHLSHVRESWAQWFEIPDDAPSIYRTRWLVPRHRQFAIARWDTSRRKDIVYSFWNGSGLILWENIFGSHNPYSRDDRQLLLETSALLDQYEAVLAHGTWLPLVPTGVNGLDANRFTLGNITVTLLRNRTKAPLVWVAPEDGTAFWQTPREVKRGGTIDVTSEGVQAFVTGDPGAANACARFVELSGRASRDRPQGRRSPTRIVIPPPQPSEPSGEMIALPGGTFPMRVVHERRECGCYPEGATDDALWGWFYKDTLTHEATTTVAPFSIRKTAVTNEDFLAFVRRTGYVPHDPTSFLKHLPRSPDGALPRALDPHVASLPVTYVSLADARAFAAAHGERLPTEAEWQWAAEGPHRGHRYPWGNNERSFPAELRPARDKTTATREGVFGLSGNAWELTESEHTDGHTRFVMLRGGVYLPPGESEWLVPRGARPNDWHAKYILLADGLDRSETISFRTVR